MVCRPVSAMDAEVSDESLMLRYSKGDSVAFEILYTRHKGPLFRYFLRQGLDRALGEELFQEVWLSLIRNGASYRVEARFTTYLYRLAHSRLVDHYRRSQRANICAAEVEDIPADPYWQPEQVIELSQRETLLTEGISKLPAEQREVFLLRAEAGMKLEEIAETLGIPLETAKSRLRYAVSKLTRCVREDAPQRTVSSLNA
jgi:RNA polymerase sigma-70 factor, ECF subfamily